MSKKARAAKGEGSFVFNEDRTITHRKSVGRKPNGQRKILKSILNVTSILLTPVKSFYNSCGLTLLTTQ